MDSSSEYEKSLPSAPLLTEESKQLHESKYNSPSRQKVHRWTQNSKSFNVWILVHVVLILGYSVLFLVVLRHSVRKEESGKLLPLPAREALKLELRRFPTELQNNPFAGVPRDELDDAWHDLLRNDNIYLPQESFTALNLNSVFFKDESHGIASLSVYHSLHCLKLVRRMIYKEYYHPNLTGVAMERQQKHADHCVEYIRESLMCKPDISLVTFRWINDTAQHPSDPDSFFPTNFDSSLHECMNWDALDDWAGQRMFNLYDLSVLNRPST